jgi:hypothetical protein
MATKSKIEANKKVLENTKKQVADQKKESDAQAQISKKGKRTRLRALVGLAGHYNLPYSEGMEFSINEKKAAEIVENKHAEKVK